MNLYVPNAQLDSPFGYGDLEWLYRQQDVDGGSLVSRLAQLAPVSFSNPVDGQRRRRLFALDSWEMNNFAWTNDNPGALGLSATIAPFAYNSRFTQNADAGFTTLNVPASTNANIAGLPTRLSRRTIRNCRQRRQRRSRRRRRRWPSGTRRSTSTTRCRSPTIPTRRSARSGSAIPTRRSRRSCRRGRSIRPRSWRSSAST